MMLKRITFIVLIAIFLSSCTFVLASKKFHATNSLPFPLGNACAEGYDRFAILVGGITKETNRSTVVLNMEMRTEQWESLDTALPVGNSGAMFCDIGANTLYTVGPELHGTNIVFEMSLDTHIWHELPKPLEARSHPDVIAYYDYSLLLFGGAIEDNVPESNIEYLNLTNVNLQTRWSVIASMEKYNVCRCYNELNVYVVSLCAPCEKNASWWFLKYLPATHTFLESVPFPLDHGEPASLSTTTIGQYTIYAVTYPGLADMALYYYDMYLNQVNRIWATEISKPRHHGATFVSTFYLYYVGGLLENGEPTVEVDAVEVAPKMQASPNRGNRTYTAGESIIISTISCSPGISIRIATTPRCTHNAAGTKDTPCSQTFTEIKTSAPEDSAYICMTNGNCNLDESERVPCSNEGATYTSFENCTFNGCCFDKYKENPRTRCFQPGPNGIFFVNVDLRKIIIKPAHIEPEKSKVRELLSKWYIILSICAGCLIIILFAFRLFWWRIKVAIKSDPLLSTAAKKYKLVRMLGQGAFGTVYLVRRKMDGKEFALKYLIIPNEEEREYALKEFDLIRSAQGHPAMIRMYDMFMSYSGMDDAEAQSLRVATKSNVGPGKKKPTKDKKGKKEGKKKKNKNVMDVAPRYLCIVMDYCSEGDFRDYIMKHKSEKVPEKVVLDVFCVQICSLLAHLHSLNPPIVHRDLKPENILLADNASRILVTDFGLAQQVENVYMTTRAGSLHYLAPECWKRHYTASIDMWAVGCIMYAACTGRVTPQRARVMFNDAKEKHFERDIRQDLSMLGYTRVLQEVILGLLKVDPAHRWTSNQVLDYIERSKSSTSTAVVELEPTEKSFLLRLQQ